MRPITKLNLNTNPSTISNGDMIDCRNMVATVDQKALTNENGFELIHEFDGDIVGKIETPTGYVICVKNYIDVVEAYTEYIAEWTEYVDESNGMDDPVEYFHPATTINHPAIPAEDAVLWYDKDVLVRIVRSSYLNFNKSIKGCYTYNSEKDLIITLTEGVNSINETRVLNVSNPIGLYNEDGITVILSENDVTRLNMIPDVEYPEMGVSVKYGGSIKVGVYQISISYKINSTNYTNHSMMSRPTYVFGDTEDDYALGDLIALHLEVASLNIDRRYSEYRLGILYKGLSDIEETYVTEDFTIDTDSIQVARIKSMSSLIATSIEELTVNPIAYIKDQDHTIFRNRLIRGNVSTIDYTGLDSVLQSIANSVSIGVLEIPLSNPFTTRLTNDSNIGVVEIRPYFKEGEQYFLYLGAIDYKGELINAYPIPHKVDDDTEAAYIDSSETISIHKIPYNYSNRSKQARYITATLPSNIESLLGTYSPLIKSFCYFYAEHTLTDSRIVGQGFVIRDTEVNDFNASQTYTGQFGSLTKLRYYALEHLYNKAKLPDVNIYGSKKTYGFKTTDVISANSQFAKYISDTTLTDLNPLIVDSSKYILPDNTSVDNIAGDSYHRLVAPSSQINELLGGTPVVPTHYNPVEGITELVTDVTVDDSYTVLRNLSGIIELVNRSQYVYADLYNNKLVMSSPIITKSKTTSTQLNGDFFYNNITFRMTTPKKQYVYGAAPELQDEDHVIKVVISVNLESRYNARGIHSGTNNYQKKFNLSLLNSSTTKELFDRPYKYDNFINTSEGKGYQVGAHYNGYDNIVYAKELDIRSNMTSRIIRSVIQNAESKGISFRFYNAAEYKDMSLSRGIINIVESDDKNVYVQQEHSLSIVGIRDTLGTNDVQQSYLGSSDIFDREPVEPLYDKHGYIGCDNRFGGVIIPIGYVVIDSIKKNIILVKDNEVVKLNNPDTEEWFRTNLISGKDDPYSNNGYILMYDDTLKSLFITNQASNQTLHYNFTHSAWISSHDYTPIQYITNRFNTYCVFANEIYSRNSFTKKCIYNGADVYRSYVTYAYTEQLEIFKQICAISWDTLVRNNGLDVYDKTFDKILVYNSTQCTGELVLNSPVNWFDTVSGVYKRDVWYLNDIQDIVIDDKLPIINTDGTLNIDNLNIDSDWFSKSDFISKFIFIKFIFENTVIEVEEITSQEEIIINSYDINAIKSIR